MVLLQKVGVSRVYCRKIVCYSQTMKKLSQERIGEVTIFSSAVLWSLFPILTILSFSGLPPMTSLAWVTFLSLLFFLCIALVRSSWVNIFKKDILFPLLGATLITGILYYVLFFFGLQRTSAGNAGILGTLEILFSFLFFNVWRKEFIDRKHIIGAIFMLLSAAIILSPNLSHIQIGDFFILGAVFIVPLGNHLQKQLRKKMNSEQILFYRTLLATPALFLFVFLLGETIKVPTSEMWPVLLISGIVLFGFTKILWIESIHRIGVTKSISLSSVGPAFTLLFAFLILKDVPTLVQLLAIPLAILGVYFLTRPIAKVKND